MTDDRAEAGRLIMRAYYLTMGLGLYEVVRLVVEAHAACRRNPLAAVDSLTRARHVLYLTASGAMVDEADRSMVAALRALGGVV